MEEARTELRRLIEERSGHVFSDPALVERSLTHRSYSAEQQEDHNERLEFLGDAVLGLACAGWLYSRFQGVPEGRLARRKSYLVSRQALAALARELDLGAALRLGQGEARSGGREKPSLLADAMEAVLGALYLDGGLGPVLTLLAPFFEERLSAEPMLEGQDAKTRLQEYQQARGGALPRYRVVRSSGPDHEKEFVVECHVDGSPVAVGRGSSKKRAELAAAILALEGLPGADVGETGPPISGGKEV